jgi:hypothetical protein
MEFALMLHKKIPSIRGCGLPNDPIKESRHSTIGLLKMLYEREVPLFIVTLWMVLKDNLIGEVKFSCSKVTNVATISTLVVSNASVVRSYIQHGYILVGGILLFGRPVDKDALIRRSRFDEGIDHRTSGTPISYKKASPEIAEADLIAQEPKRPRPACSPNRAPMLAIEHVDI